LEVLSTVPNITVTHQWEVFTIIPHEPVKPPVKAFKDLDVVKLQAARIKAATENPISFLPEINILISLIFLTCRDNFLPLHPGYDYSSG
jgi:hypothetical protein